MRLIIYILLCIFIASPAWAGPIKVIFGGVGKSFDKDRDPDALTADQKLEEMIYEKILFDDANWDIINEGLEDFFVDFSGRSGVKIDFLGIGVKVKKKQADVKALIAVLSFDKLVSFDEKISVNNKDIIKKTAYAAFSLYLLELKTKKLVFSRPFIIPFIVLKDDIKIYNDNIIGGVKAFFTEPKYWREASSILGKCLSDPALIFDPDAETYGATRITLSDGTLKRLDSTEAPKMKALAVMIANSFLSYHHLVIPTQRHTEREFAEQAQMAAVALNIFIKQNPRSRNIHYDEEGGYFSIGLKLPMPVNPIKILVKTGRKVKEDRKYHQTIQFKALAQLTLWDKKYKCLDAVTATQAKGVGATNIYYFNALINAVSKLKGDLNACSK